MGFSETLGGGAFGGLSAGGLATGGPAAGICTCGPFAIAGRTTTLGAGTTTLSAGTTAVTGGTARSFASAFTSLRMPGSATFLR
jgi:hypothetical protein